MPYMRKGDSVRFLHLTAGVAIGWALQSLFSGHPKIVPLPTVAQVVSYPSMDMRGEWKTRNGARAIVKEWNPTLGAWFGDIFDHSGVRWDGSWNQAGLSYSRAPSFSTSGFEPGFDLMASRRGAEEWR